MEIRDALTLELVSALQLAKVATRFKPRLAYSPDGRSLAGCSDTSIVIWDTKTGGVVNKIGCKFTGNGRSLCGHWMTRRSVPFRHGCRKPILCVRVTTTSPQVQHYLPAHSSQNVNHTSGPTTNLSRSRQQRRWVTRIGQSVPSRLGPLLQRLSIR